MSTTSTTVFNTFNAFLFAFSSTLLISAPVFAAPKNDTAIAASTKATSHANNGNAYGHEKRDETNAPQISQDHASKPATTQAQTTTAASLTTVSTKPADHNPAGNNGFIRVNEEIVPDGTPNNDPHVGCSFKVEFYNYDNNPNYRANVQFALHEPTKDGRTMTVTGNTNPFIGQDSAGGGNDRDAVETYRLNFTGAPHAQQGYHVKLTIHADGSQGSDVKHKVFWVKPCATAVTPTQPETNVLGTTTKPVNTVAATLPAILPSTGLGIMGLIGTLIAAAATYLITLRYQKSRA